jgi:hypothetical protein
MGATPVQSRPSQIVWFTKPCGEGNHYDFVDGKYTKCYICKSVLLTDNTKFDSI